MKVVVIGGTGTVGRGVVEALRAKGHEVVAAAPETGVDTLIGEGLDDAVTGADVVLDVTNSPVYDEQGATDFFRTSAENQARAERAAGVKHHVLLSIVGVDREHALGYYHAKVAQERVVRDGGIPFSIVRSTQFAGYIKFLIENAAQDGTARLPATLVQPIVLEELVAQLADVVTAPPVGDVVQVAGPEVIAVDEAARILFAETGQPVHVVTDPEARLFLGEKLSERVLLADPGARIAATGLSTWLRATRD
jgi:uncharacterized protein YbjT (DUF2867 family)